MTVTVTEIRRARRKVGICILCTVPALPEQSRCARHAAMNLTHGLTRYAKAKARQMAKIADKQAETPKALRVIPEGTRPMQCAPFHASGAAVMQRLDCARRRECLNFAVHEGWKAFTCAYCPVRETLAKVEAAGRDSMAPTSMPDLGGRVG